VHGECRHARDAQHAKSFRTRFFGFPLAWNVVWSGSRLGSGVFSALRLHPLLRSVRLHLRSARSFRLPALRAAGELFSAAWLLHLRRPPRTDHGAVSAGNGPTGTTVSFRPPHSDGSRQPANRVNLATIDLRLCGCGLREWEKPMGLRAYLLAFGLAALLNLTPATFGHSAPWCAWCTDDPATSDSGYYAMASAG
jgi:hypothetical protein